MVGHFPPTTLDEVGRESPLGCYGIRVIFQKWHTKVTPVINKESSLTEVALIDFGADMNCIQEELISLKYYRSFERLTQILNYKIPNVHICNDGIFFEIVFKDLSSKVVLPNPFMALLYPFLMTNEGIKINMLIFRFTSPLISKEIRFLNKVTILKDINKQKICRTKGHLIEKSLDDQLTDNVIKKFKQDTEMEIYSPIAFLHRH